MVDIDEGMSESEAIIGYILSELYSAGLRAKTFSRDDFLHFDSNFDASLMVDVVIWMHAEGLIYLRTDLQFSVRNRALAKKHMKVEELQLSSKGKELFVNSDVKALVEVAHSPSGTDEASLSTYTKLGALVGSLLGGFTKSIS